MSDSKKDYYSVNVKSDVNKNLCHHHLMNGWAEDDQVLGSPISTE